MWVFELMKQLGIWLDGLFNTKISFLDITGLLSINYLLYWFIGETADYTSASLVLLAFTVIQQFKGK